MYQFTFKPFHFCFRMWFWFRTDLNKTFGGSTDLAKKKARIGEFPYSYSPPQLWYTWPKKDSRQFFIQSEVKLKPIVTRSRAFSRALRQLLVITSNFDWFTVTYNWNCSISKIRKSRIKLALIFFPALGVSSMNLLGVLIVSMDCLRPLWLARLIPAVLVHDAQLKNALKTVSSNWSARFFAWVACVTVCQDLHVKSIFFV